jgi:serine phosphatase RsbU (regulator of sigma subunit)/PAS domain-containing protein
MAAASRRRLFAAALAAEAALAVVDIVTGQDFLARSLYLLPVLALAVRGQARDVAATGIAAVVLVLVSPVWNDEFGQEWLVPLAIVAAGSAIATWAAGERDAAQAERRQIRLLAEAAQITDGAADVEDALRRLVRLLVPDLGDAAWIDVAGPGGELRRLATRVAGDDAAELEAWLLDRPLAHPPGTLSRSAEVLAGEGAQISDLDPPTVDRIAAGPDDRRRLAQSGLRMAMAVPLAVHDRTLGVLSLGTGPSGRRFGPADLAFAELLAGRAALALANAQLVGRLSAAQERLDGILGALAEAVTVHDAAGRILYANRAAADLLGVAGVEDLLAADPGELIARYATTDEDGKPIPGDALPGYRVIRGEAPEPLLTRTVLRDTGDVRWLLTKATPLPGESGQVLAVNVIEDVTDETEARLRERFLTDAGKALASSLDYEETLQRVARLAVPRMADWCAVELPDERGTLHQVALAHVDPEKISTALELRERWPPDPDAPMGTHAVLRSGQAQIVPEVTDAMLVAGAQDEEHLARIRELGLSSGMIVPMVAGGRTLGVLSLVFAGDRRYSEDDLPVAEELAARAATAVENARLYTERSTAARTLQASLLPDRLPTLHGWRAAADYRAGEAGVDVGGDFYDVFPVPDGAVVILGDVTGKGVAAAALTSLVRHTARTGAHFDSCPSALLALVNTALRRQDRVAPVTMLCGLLRAGELTLAAGGHPLPLLKRAGEPVRKVGEPGLLLGAVDTYAGARDVVIPLAPGDTLLLYTDGVTDTPGERGRFGEAGLLAAVDGAPEDPDAVLARVKAALDAFQRGTVVDDRAMLALQYTGAAGRPSDGAGYGGESAPSSATVPEMTALAGSPFSK